MKRNSVFTFFNKMMTLFAVSYLISCKKEVSQNLALENPPLFAHAISKVNTWLENQKSVTYPDKNLILEAVRNNLDFKNIQLEELNNTENLIVVPIKCGFKSAVNKDKSPLNVLLLIINEAGNIRKGNIVQFCPVVTLPGNVLAKNTFYNFYNKYHLITDGSYTFLNMHDKILYQLEYEKGNLVSNGEKQNGKNSSTNGSYTPPTGSNCIEWYLVTTYHLPNGMTYTTEQYLYTTCNGQGQVELPQPEETGGGGGDEVTMQPKQVEWIVAANANAYWYVNSTEELNGTKKPSLPSGGYFTSITHLSENVVNVSGSGYVWTRSGVTVSYAGSSAQSAVSGILKSPTNTFPDTNIPPKTHNFSFSQVYP